MDGGTKVMDAQCLFTGASSIVMLTQFALISNRPKVGV